MFLKYSDEIAFRRREIWFFEFSANGQVAPGQSRGLSRPTGSAAEVEDVRDRKTELRQIVLDRVKHGATHTGLVKESVPSGIETAWQQWERHTFQPIIATPWKAYSSFPGAVLNAAIPPGALP